MMKRLAFVIQRYGPDVNGGAEELCRQVAERIAPEVDVEILTTCARDYITWANDFPEGVETINGVTVRRFAVARQRKVRAFGRFSQKIFGKPHTFAQEAEWMDRQGPDVPGLYPYISGSRDTYDLFVFFTYLYPPTFFGMPLVAEKSLLAPMAHDEPPLALGLFRNLFHLPRGLIFNTDEERRFVHETFHNDYLPWTIGGAGIDIPEKTVRGERTDNYILYLGRVDVEKGCGELMDFFTRYKKKHPSGLKLLMAGDVNMKVPSVKEIVPLGFVSSESKKTLLANALALILPSRFESLSLSALEAWAHGTPVIANSASRVLVDHMEKSEGGWLYGGYQNFAGILNDRLGDDEALKKAGLSGRRYVSRTYSWKKVTKSYLTFLRQMTRETEKGSARRD